MRLTQLNSRVIDTDMIERTGHVAVLAIQQNLAPMPSGSFVWNDIELPEVKVEPLHASARHKEKSNAEPMPEGSQPVTADSGLTRNINRTVPGNIIVAKERTTSRSIKGERLEHAKNVHLIVYETRALDIPSASKYIDSFESNQNACSTTKSHVMYRNVPNSGEVYR